MINFKDIMNGNKKKTTRRQPSKGIRLSSYKPKRSNDIDKVLGKSKASLNMNNIFGNSNTTKVGMFQSSEKPIQSEKNQGLNEVRNIIKKKKGNVIIINNHYGQEPRQVQSSGPRTIKKVMTAFDGNDKLGAVYDSDLDGVPDHLDSAPHDPEIRMPLTRQGNKNSRSNKAIMSILDDV